jgi:hypothetical protein
VTAGLSAVADERPRARLTYVRLPGAGRCPDEEGLRNAVSARLGYSPFDEQASLSLVATVYRTNSGLSGHVEIKGQGERLLVSTNRDCQELAASIALAISIAIDPIGPTRPAPVAAVQVTPAPPVAPVQVIPESPPVASKPVAPAVLPASPTPVIPPPEKPATSTKVHVAPHVGVLGSLGSAPSAAFGLVLGVRVKWTLFSFGTEVRFDVNAPGTSGLGNFTTSLLTGTLLPCLHKGPFGVCAMVSGGALRAAGEGVSGSQRVTLPSWGLGARIQAEFMVPAGFFVLGHLDVLSALVRASLLIGTTEVWVTPPVNGSLGLSVGYAF